MGNRLGNKLGDTEKKILEQILADKNISISKLSEKVGISTTAIENNLTKLKEKGILKRIGKPKSGYWEIIKPD